MTSIMMKVYGTIASPHVARVDAYMATLAKHG